MGNETKPTIVRHSMNGTILDPDNDLDLQHLALSKFDTPKRGKEEAIKKINKITGLSLKESDFTQTYFQTDMMTGKKNEPVEWSNTCDGMHKGQAGKWTTTISMDDPSPDSHGPDRPHIGYRVDFDRKRVTSGHVYVNSVPASRMGMKVRSAFEKRR